MTKTFVKCIDFKEIIIYLINFIDKKYLNIYLQSIYNLFMIYLRFIYN